MVEEREIRLWVLGNLFWDMQFRTCENFEESTDFYLVLSSKFSQIQKSHTAITSIAIRCTNRLRIKRTIKKIRHCEKREVICGNSLGFEVKRNNKY